MSRKKAGVVGTVKKKIWTVWASIVAMCGGSLTAYFWADIGKFVPGVASAGADKNAPLVSQVVGNLVNLQKSRASVKSEMLGCDIAEENDRVTVVDIEPGSAAALLGLIPGDIIESVDSHPVTSFESLAGSLARSRVLFSTIIQVKRGAATLRGDVVRASDEKLNVRRPLAQ